MQVALTTAPAAAAVCTGRSEQVSNTVTNSKLPIPAAVAFKAVLAPALAATEAAVAPVPPDARPGAHDHGRLPADRATRAAGLEGGVRALDRRRGPRPAGTEALQTLVFATVSPARVRTPRVAGALHLALVSATVVRRLRGVEPKSAPQFCGGRR